LLPNCSLSLLTGKLGGGSATPWNWLRDPRLRNNLFTCPLPGASPWTGVLNRSNFCLWHLPLTKKKRIMIDHILNHNAWRHIRLRQSHGHSLPPWARPIHPPAILFIYRLGFTHIIQDSSTEHKTRTLHSHYIQTNPPMYTALVLPNYVQMSPGRLGPAGTMLGSILAI